MLTFCYFAAINYNVCFFQLIENVLRIRKILKETIRDYRRLELGVEHNDFRVDCSRSKHMLERPSQSLEIKPI